MSDVSFAKLSLAKNPAKKVYEDEKIFGLRNQSAGRQPTFCHPKKHIAGIDQLRKRTQS